MADNKELRIIDIALEPVSFTEGASSKVAYRPPLFVHRLLSQLWYWIIYCPYKFILRANSILVWFKMRDKRK